MCNFECIVELINQGVIIDCIKDCVVEEGMIILLAYSFNLVQEGYIILEEVEWVIFIDIGLELEMWVKCKSVLICCMCVVEL